SLLQVGAKRKSRHFVGGKDESRRQAESYSSSLASIKFLFHRILRVIPNWSILFMEVAAEGSRRMIIAVPVYMSLA
uniref:hypothetical protein n=1 Tax=Draconibacterium sp. TaxID=1965318 RepID=UPI00356A06D7